MVLTHVDLIEKLLQYNRESVLCLHLNALKNSHRPLFSYGTLKQGCPGGTIVEARWNTSRDDLVFPTSTRIYPTPEIVDGTTFSSLRVESVLVILFEKWRQT